MARRPGSEKVYETFSQFIDRCLIHDYSLIWPDEEVWTLENLQWIKKDFIDNPLWEGEYWEKIIKQFGELNDASWKALADALFAFTLPSSSISPEKKYSLIKTVCEHKGFYLPDFSEATWDVLHQGLVRTTMNYHFKYKQLWLLFWFALEVKKIQNREAFLEDHLKVKDLLDRILNDIPEAINQAWDMRHAILHMAFPNSYEHIISSTHKRDIITAFKNRIPTGKRGANLDEQLYFIRQNFERSEYADTYFHFYLPEIKAKWFGRNGGVPRNGDGYEVDPLLEDLDSLLRSNKQIILYGPPGTGKTYYAFKLAREVIAQDNYEKSYAELEDVYKQRIRFGGVFGSTESEDLAYLYLCTFHPAFGYEEFIEGFRPYSEKGGLFGFVLRDGVFKRVCRQAIASPDKTFILVIDEINRGNIPRIFGELITLIEKDKRWHQDKSDNIGLILPTSGEVFYVPNNVLLIGTMNTADRSISLLDIALRRRFGFRELMPMPELLDNQEIEGLNLGTWLRELNRRILSEVGRNLQVGHSYLMEKGEPIKEVGELASRLQNDIMPLLQEYCYDDYNKLAVILGSAIVDVDSKTFKLEMFKGKQQDNLIKVLKGMCDGV